jgi:hypothetical protein
MTDSNSLQQEEKSVVLCQRWIAEAVALGAESIARDEGAFSVCELVDGLGESEAKTILKVAIFGLALTEHELFEEQLGQQLGGAPTLN